MIQGTIVYHKSSQSLKFVSKHLFCQYLSWLLKRFGWMYWKFEGSKKNLWRERGFEDNAALLSKLLEIFRYFASLKWTSHGILAKTAFKWYLVFKDCDAGNNNFIVLLQRHNTTLKHWAYWAFLAAIYGMWDNKSSELMMRLSEGYIHSHCCFSWNVEEVKLTEYSYLSTALSKQFWRCLSRWWTISGNLNRHGVCNPCLWRDWTRIYRSIRGPSSATNLKLKIFPKEGHMSYRYTVLCLVPGKDCMHDWGQGHWRVCSLSLIGRKVKEVWNSSIGT